MNSSSSATASARSSGKCGLNVASRASRARTAPMRSTSPARRPVTLATGGTLAAVHFQLLGPRIPLIYGAAEQICLMPGAVVYDAEIWRLLTSTVRHISDYHLYWSLGSLASKGLALEPRLGSPRFGLLLFQLSLLCLRYELIPVTSGLAR